MPKLIALTGPAGAGKSTVARYLEDDGWVRVSFAQPLKDAVAALGVSTADISKEDRSPTLGGLTPRLVYQDLGDVYKRLFGPDVFLLVALRKVDLAVHAGQNVIIDDLRYAREAAAVTSRGGDVIKLTGRATCGVPSHSSEDGINPLLIDREVSNAGDLDVTISEILHLVPEGWSHDPPKDSGLYHIRWCRDRDRSADVANLDVSVGDWTSTETGSRTACADPSVLWGPRIESPT